MLEKLESGDFEGMAEIIRGMGHRDIDSEDIRAFVESRNVHRQCRVDTERRDSAANDACSFCDLSRDMVTTLVDGPRASICDRCIDDASADVLNTLVTT